jgi:hypothetical protein
MAKVVLLSVLLAALKTVSKQHSLLLLTFLKEVYIVDLDIDQEILMDGQIGHLLPTLELQLDSN